MHQTAATASDPRPFLWTRAAYYAMGESGLFDGKRVQLIAGEIVEMSPMGRPHALAVIKIVEYLRQLAGGDYHVQSQLPLALGNRSEPEPDAALIAGAASDYNDHPATAALIVEVSESTLAFDRAQKGSLYARHGIPEYWIVNLSDRQLEIYRTPIPDPAASSGWQYGDRQILAPDASAAPLARPDAAIAVCNLLPQPAA
ncbi:uncharacterized protein conserved in cyanobacteria [Rubidibacter lacunae KORDI 51-2]|uniref:Uncharacterized protein conserved in cyanobacteria n=1 Tax=Rubidibacter lacunae KORDI 51-2 TaxID=582515 RepID=U5DQG5_9CHRO|nr:Uma2 family endonuclease [Rubidibacter lacunae]ERN41930.1 uncharacterized protein conserved in cyanobacteria [Rubidibacter lacunae KORDI 51-2]